MHDWQSLSHVRWDCKYHVVIVPKYRKKVIYGKLKRRQYVVDGDSSLSYLVPLFQQDKADAAMVPLTLDKWSLPHWPEEFIQSI